MEIRSVEIILTKPDAPDLLHRSTITNYDCDYNKNNYCKLYRVWGQIPIKISVYTVKINQLKCMKIFPIGE